MENKLFDDLNEINLLPLQYVAMTINLVPSQYVGIDNKFVPFQYMATTLGAIAVRCFEYYFGVIAVQGNCPKIHNYRNRLWLIFSRNQ